MPSLTPISFEKMSQTSSDVSTWNLSAILDVGQFQQTVNLAHRIENFTVDDRITNFARISPQSGTPSAVTPKVASRQQAQASPKSYIIPPLPFEFLWDVPQSDEAAYRRGETVYTFARRPGDMYKAHYWIWHDFKTGKPQFSFDPPKNRDIPHAFLQHVVSSGGKFSQLQPTSKSTGLGLLNPSSGSAPNDDVCIANGQPVSGDFKRFLENHPGMDFYEAKRKFKEEQKAKQWLRPGPKYSH